MSYETDDATKHDDAAASENAHSSESKESSSLYFILFATLLFAVLVMSKYLHEAPRLNKYLSEASLILMVGLIVSFLTETFLQYDAAQALMRVEDDDDYFSYSQQNKDDDESDEDLAFKRLLSFSPNIFFMALLPPILFNSGYQLRRELFLRHIYPIVMFAVMGTITSSIVCAMMLWALQQWHLFSTFDPTLLELFAFGSLIAATDTVSVIAVLQAKRVDPHLFYVVFGESALNDAVALVLYNSFADLLRADKDYSYEAFVAFFPEFLVDAVGSPLLGMAFGFGFALLFKAVDLRRKKYRMLELSLYLMLMYVPFMIAESMHLSGIVTIFFAGLSVRRYVAPNVSRVTEKAGATIFQLVAFLSETCIFLELGLSIFGFSGSFNWDFIIYSLICCLIARGAAIYPLALLHNYAVSNEEQQQQQFQQQQQQQQQQGRRSNHTTPMALSPSSLEATSPTSQHSADFAAAALQNYSYVPPTQIEPTTFGQPSSNDNNNNVSLDSSINTDSTTPTTNPSPATTTNRLQPPVLDAVWEEEGAESSGGSGSGATSTVAHTTNPPTATTAAAGAATTALEQQPQQPLTSPAAVPTVPSTVSTNVMSMSNQPTPHAHNMSSSSHQGGGPLGMVVQQQPFPPPGGMVHHHHHHHHHHSNQAMQAHHRNARNNSFDTEDTRGSVTTVTTHQSRKRRERRGRMMNNVKKERISWEMMHILWFAGLRGAVAYACVREFPNVNGNADEFTAATMFIVLFTIVIMGGLTETMLGWLGIEMGVDLEEYMDIFRQEQEESGALHDFGTYCSSATRRRLRSGM